MPLYDFQCGEGHRFERVVPLARFGDQQVCALCDTAAIRLISAPRIKMDVIPPTRGPDGRLHDSLASYRHACTPDGNPQRESYAEIGNAELPTIERKFDRAQRREDIKKGIEDVKYGRVPPVVTGDIN